MNEIKKLTNAIRNYSESELCYGTVVTLSKIDNEANRLEQENAELRQQVEAMREAQTKALDLLSICANSYDDNRELLDEWERIRLEEIKGSIAALEAAGRDEYDLQK